jgi:hypothetical protein
MCLPYIFFRVQGHYTAAFQYYQKTKQFTAQFCPKSTQFQLTTGAHPKAITKQKLDCQKENQKRSLNRNPLNHTPVTAQESFIRKVFTRENSKKTAALSASQATDHQHLGT